MSGPMQVTKSLISQRTLMLIA